MDKSYHKQTRDRIAMLVEQKREIERQLKDAEITALYATERAFRFSVERFNNLFRQSCIEYQEQAYEKWHDRYGDRVEPILDDESVRAIFHFNDAEQLPKVIDTEFGRLYNVGPSRWVLFEDGVCDGYAFVNDGP